MHPMRRVSGISLFVVITIMDITARPLMINSGNEQEDGFIIDSFSSTDTRGIDSNILKGNLNTGLSNSSRLSLSSVVNVGASLNIVLDDSEEFDQSETDIDIEPATPSSLRQIANVSTTPEYMLQLYNQLSENSPTIHNSNIIRSFKHIPHTNTDSTRFLERNGFRIHSLVFDISTISRKERTNLAELRLFTLITRDQKSFMGVSRLVSIYEVIHISAEGETDFKKYNYITSKYIHSIDNAWESFDVTAAVKRSIRDFSNKEHLEVRIQSLFTDPSQDNMDINANPNDMKQPLLVVYSNDISTLHEHATERHELIMHEVATNTGANFRYTTQLSSENPSDMYINAVLNREKRSRGHRRSADCKRRPMHVKFEDIHWDSWIIAPRGYQIGGNMAYQCSGKCYFPLSDHLTPSNHAIVQTTLHTYYPRQTTRACCVPTKLNPISILYIDALGVVTYKFKYDGMVVAECGCR